MKSILKRSLVNGVRITAALFFCSLVLAVFGSAGNFFAKVFNWIFGWPVPLFERLFPEYAMLPLAGVMVALLVNLVVYSVLAYVVLWFMMKRHGSKQSV